MGIQLFFTNPLVALQEEFSSSALAQVNRAGMDVAQRARGGKPFGPPHAGTGRPFCSWRNLGQSAELSDIDTPAWRNGESLRVRYSSITTRPRRWSCSVIRCLTLADACRRIATWDRRRTNGHQRGTLVVAGFGGSHVMRTSTSRST